MPPPQDTRKCVWMEGPPVSLCAIRNGPTASLPPLQGHSWRRKSPLFPSSDSKAIESCAQTRSARQRAGEGRRSYELQPTGPLALSEPLSPRPSPRPSPRAARRETDEGLEGPRWEMHGTGHCQNSQSQAARPGHADSSQGPTRARRDRGDTSLPLRPLNPNPGYRVGHTCPWWGRPSPDVGRGPWSGPRGPCALAASPHQGLGGRGPEQGGAPSAHCLGTCTRQAGLISGRELGAAKQDPPCRGASRAVPTLSQASWVDRRVLSQRAEADLLAWTPQAAGTRGVHGALSWAFGAHTPPPGAGVTAVTPRRGGGLGGGSGSPDALARCSDEPPRGDEKVRPGSEACCRCSRTASGSRHHRPGRLRRQRVHVAGLSGAR